MQDKIFVNLPVKYLDASKAFFGKLGYSFNPQFTDNTAMANGATEANSAQGHGFMIVRSFHDLDGHVWENFCMDPSHVQG